MTVNINAEIETIRNAPYARDVRDAIADSLKQMMDVAGNEAKFESYVTAVTDQFLQDHPDAVAPTDEQVKAWCDANGVTTGATAEEAAQIQQNAAEVTSLKSDLRQLSEEIANLSSSGSGLSQTLRVAIYNLLMDAAYQSSGHETDKAALEELLTGSSGGGESGGEGEEVIYYTIEKTLTNVSISNGAVSVAAGSVYSATLTADEGYTLDSVTVTMGGEAVLVTDGIISIASVTGNIVITATAANEESGNDPFAGTWTEGFRLQSNGTEYATGHPGYDTTDYVDCTNFSTVTISATSDLGNQIINAVVWYDDSKAYISGEGKFFINLSDNTNYPSSLSFTKVDGAAYCRICLESYENFNISVE